MITIERIMDDGSVVLLASLGFDQVGRLGLDEFAKQIGGKTSMR